MRVVYRVEHPNGRGPYQSVGGYSARLQIPSQHWDWTDIYPGPFVLDSEYYGCRSMGALRRWFGRRTLRVLRAHGFRTWRLVVRTATEQPKGQRTFRWSDVVACSEVVR